MDGPRLTIGFDCDDVLVNTAEYTARRYNETYGTPLTRDHWYDFSSMEPWGVEALPQAVKRVQDLMHADDFTELEPLADAEKTLQRLKSLGHALIVITGRPETQRPQTAALLDTVYPTLFEPNDIYFTDHFATGAGKLVKADVATALGVTHFVDDQIEHVNGMAAAGIKAVLFSDGYTWNQTAPAEGVVRVRNWREIGEYFDDERRAA